MAPSVVAIDGVFTQDISRAVLAPTYSVETFPATVMFAHMRGYAALAERLPPGRVLSILEEYFDVLGTATEAQSGEVFHMAGEGMMAGFGIRNPAKSGAREALAAGRAILRLFSSISTRCQREHSIVTGIGIGLHFGEVALADFRWSGQRTPTLVGDTANVAARLCRRACCGEILFSSAVVDALGAEGTDFGPIVERPSFLLLPQFALRGRSALLDIWCAPAPE
jgi:class 3 adenylate cyclase